MTPFDLSRLPRVIATSVIRSTRQGDSHGGVYLVDLATGESERVLDWDDPGIRWDGRGGDRGLRGVAIRGERVYMAASDEIFVFDLDFKIQGSYRNRYLRHCHEISLREDRLFVTSTGFDAVLEIDLSSGEFVHGCSFRYPAAVRKLNRWLPGRNPAVRRRLVRMTTFDPREGGGPEERDTIHVNNVAARDDGVWVSGQRLDLLLRTDGARVLGAFPVPYGTHNAMPDGGGIVFNHTGDDSLVAVDGNGEVVFSAAVPIYDPEALRMGDVPRDHARQGFGRGLCAWGEDVLVGGSSPATITAYDRVDGTVLRSVNVSMDVRNAIHGLEIWPFG